MKAARRILLYVVLTILAWSLLQTAIDESLMHVARPGIAKEKVVKTLGIADTTLRFPVDPFYLSDECGATGLAEVAIYRRVMKPSLIIYYDERGVVACTARPFLMERSSVH